MAPNRIVVKYFNERMLLTVDLQTLFTFLFEEYGDGVNIAFAEMDVLEKSQSSEDVDGILAVRDRFHILETTHTNDVRRRDDLERLAAHFGRK